MKTYISHIIPELERFSKKLDDLTFLINQHWVVVDDVNNVKSVYIFRNNSQLLISNNGKVKKARWEYLGNNSLLIDKEDESYLFKQGFLDENILALKVDSKDEYAFLVNENKYSGELNSFDKVMDFLTQTYLNKKIERILGDKQYGSVKHQNKAIWLETKKGRLEIKASKDWYIRGDLVFLDSQPAPDGKYVIGWPSWANYIIVKDGKIDAV
ncbi:MAG: hypothetical protein WBG71_15770 [Leeuwenhoekiella sp.]